MNLFDLVATLQLDTKPYESELGSVRSKAKTVGAGIGKALKTGGAIVAGITAGVTALSVAFTNGAKDVANYGDNVDKMSQKLGLSAEAYQKWDYVIQLSGADIDHMASGLKTLTNKLEDAKNGGKKSIETFQKLGISMDELEGASREEVFERTIKAFQGMEDSAERAALANKLFGRSGQELAPLFNQSAESTEQLLEQAEKYGMVMSEKAVKASAEFNDSLTTLSQTATGLKNRFMGEFLPSLTEVTDGLSQVFTGDMKGADKIVKGVKDLVEKLKTEIPKFRELGSKIVSGIAEAVLEGAPILFQEGTKLLVDLAKEFISSLPKIVSIGTDIITSVVDGITEAIPDLIEAVPFIITSLITAIAENAPKILASGGKLIIALVEGIIKAVPILIKQAPVIISKFIEAIKGMWSALTENGGQIITKIFEGISGVWDWFKSKVKGFISQIPTVIKNALFGIASIGANIVTGIWNGISGNIQWLKNQISNWIGNVKDFLKNLFGISSPSKWARNTIGANIVRGLALGLEDGQGLIQDSFDSLMPEYEAGEYAVSVDRPSVAGGISIINYITVDGAEDPEDFTDRFVRRLRMDMRTV